MLAAAREAWELIAQHFWGADHQQRLVAACGQLEISPPMLKVITLLEPGQEVPMRGLADKLRCDASWVTSLVDGLEDKGLAERRVLPDDRRVKAVALTEQGILARKRALAVLNEPPASFARLSAVEARQLRDLLRKAWGQ